MKIKYILYSITIHIVRTNEEITSMLISDFPNEKNIEFIKNTLWIGNYKHYYFGITEIK